MDILLAILILLLIGFLTAKLAEQRGRSPSLWFALGILGGIISIAVLFLLPPKDTEQSQLNLDRAEEYGEPQEMKETPHPYTTKLWFYLDEEHKQKGPMEFVDLATEWEDGLVKENTFLWCEEMKEWKQLKDLNTLEKLFNEFETE